MSFDFHQEWIFMPPSRQKLHRYCTKAELQEFTLTISPRCVNTVDCLYIFLEV